MQLYNHFDMIVISDMYKRLYMYIAGHVMTLMSVWMITGENHAIVKGDHGTTK